MYGYQVSDIEYTSGNCDETGKLIKDKIPTITSEYGEIGIIDSKFYFVMIFEKEIFLKDNIYPVNQLKRNLKF